MLTLLQSHRPSRYGKLGDEVSTQSNCQKDGVELEGALLEGHSDGDCGANLRIAVMAHNSRK